MSSSATCHTLPFAIAHHHLQFLSLEIITIIIIIIIIIKINGIMTLIKMDKK